MSDLRPSFQERDQYLAKLADNYAEGRLDDAEYEKRRDALLSGVTHDDLLAQFQGLPNPGVLVPTRRRTSKVVPKHKPDQVPPKNERQISAALVISVGLLAILGFLGALFGFGVMRSDETVSGGAEIVHGQAVDAVITPESVHGGLDTLIANGHTQIADVNFIGGTFFGVAKDDGGPTTSFSMEANGDIAFWEDAEEIEHQWMDIEQYRTMFDSALTQAADNGLDGEIIGISPADANGPAMQLEIATSAGIGHIIVDAGGSIIELQHP